MFHIDRGGPTPGPIPSAADYNSFMPFNDPDGNTWLVQEVKRAEPVA